MKIPRFFAQVEWTVDRKAPAGAELINPVWFPEDGPGADGWSLVVAPTAPVVQLRDVFECPRLEQSWPRGVMPMADDNETWIIETGGRVIDRKAGAGAASLSDWECLVYCVWAADYMMRNAGDFAVAADLYPDFQLDGARLAAALGLPATHGAFSLPMETLRREYFDRFEEVCDELKRAQPGDPRQ